MSKFFNETQKAHQWAQQKLENQDMDVKEMLESSSRRRLPTPNWWTRVSASAARFK